MTEVTQNQYDAFILTLVSPTIEVLQGEGTCSKIITTHLVLGEEKAEKIEHQILDEIIYKIKNT